MSSMTSHNNTQTSNLGEDPSEDFVMRELPILSFQEGLCEEDQVRAHAMIDILPDDVLVEIFDFYRGNPIVHIYIEALDGSSPPPWRWKTLTHVCRRWRNVIFGSPRRLDLRVVCTETTPTRTSLDIWPPFPITICCPSLSAENEEGVENIIAAVERRDRVFQIVIDEIDDPALEQLITAMHEPFPVLTDLCLRSYHEAFQVLPETFLGMSAPLLRLFNLWGIQFPSFHKFILSVTNVVDLELLNITNSGYISPEIMANSLVTLPNLDSLSIGHRYPESLPPIINLPPPTRAILPALSHLYFGSVSQYSEDFVARIDTPLLNQLGAVFDRDLILETPQLHDFIGRVEGFKQFNQAYIVFSEWEINMTLEYLESPTGFELETIYETSDLDVSLMTQTFGQQFPLFSHVERLEIREDPAVRFEWKYDPERDPSQWLGLFHLFVAVQRLYVNKRLVPPVSIALQELTGERTMEVLPALRNLFLEGLRPYGPTHATLKSFAAARQRSGHIVTIQRWE